MKTPRSHRWSVGLAAVLVAGILMAPPLAAAETPEDTVAIVAGKPISDSQLEEAASSRLTRLRAQEYDIKRQVLDDLIVRSLLENEAQSRGISVEELTRIEIEGKAKPVTEEDKKSFYEANKARYGNRSEEEVMKLIEPGLRQQRINARRGAFISELRAKAGVRVLLKAPRVDIALTTDDPWKGPEDAPITIVEFSDYQ